MDIVGETTIKPIILLFNFCISFRVVSSTLINHLKLIYYSKNNLYHFK